MLLQSVFKNAFVFMILQHAECFCTSPQYINNLSFLTNVALMEISVFLDDS